MASVRSFQQLPPCPMEPMPAGSKTDPPLGKAKPISDGGSDSGTTDLRRGGKNLLEKTVAREEREYVRGTTLQAPRSVQEEGRRCSRPQSRGSLQPWSRPW